MDCLLYVYLGVAINAIPPNWIAPLAQKWGWGVAVWGVTRDALKQVSGVALMAKRTRRPYAKRLFLNPIADGAPSFIQAVADSSDQGTYVLGNYLLIVADCDRRITLEFSVGNASARKKSRAKIQRFVDVVTGFRDALIREIELIDKVQKAHVKGSRRSPIS